MSEQLLPKGKNSIFGSCVEVTKSHLDVWNHTNNVCYVQWMQDVAVGHSAALGWDSERYLKAGAIWVVRSHAIDYRHSTYEGDKILVQTWVDEMKRASCIRRYRFLLLPRDCDLNEIESKYRWSSFETFDASNMSVIATATTHWAFVSTETFHPVKVFPELSGLFENAQ